MLKSFISNPYTVQRKQFTMHVIVNGKGMLDAFFVSMTVLRVERGLANKITQKSTPNFPIIFAARPVSRMTAIIAVNVMIKLV